MSEPVPTPPATLGALPPEEAARLSAVARGEPRRVLLDSVGLMAWRGLLAAKSDGQRHMAAVEEFEHSEHEKRVLSLMTHLGALDLLQGRGGLRLSYGEAGKVYLEAVPMPESQE